MKRKQILMALCLLPPILFQSCNKDIKWGKDPTIFTGTVIDENGKGIKDFEFAFGGNTGGFSPKPTFGVNTKTDETGYYYLEAVVPQGTGSVSFGANGVLSSIRPGDFQFLLFLEGRYQEVTEPFKTGQKNEFNYKIVKRIK